MKSEMVTDEKTTEALENAKTVMALTYQDTEFPTETLIEFYLVVCPQGLPLLERPTFKKIQGIYEVHPAMACPIKAAKSYSYWARRWPGTNHLAQISGPTPCEQTCG